MRKITLIILIYLFPNIAITQNTFNNTTIRDSVLTKIDKLPLGYSPQLIYNKNVGYYGIVGDKNTIAVFDSNLHQTNNGKADFIENTTKLNYEGKIYFIRYRFKDSSIRLSLTSIVDKKEIIDTVLPIFKYNYYKEKKITDKKEFSIRMESLSSPDEKSIAFIYDNNYEKGIKEGFRLRVLKNNKLSKIINVQFDYLDEVSKLGKLFFDGENIYAFVYIYNQKHTSKILPFKYAIIKYNIESQKTVQREFNVDVKTVRNLDLIGFNQDIFLLNGYVEGNIDHCWYESVKLYRFNQDFELEDSIVTDKKTVESLSFDDGMKYKKIKKWNMENRILPQSDNSFPDYQINYKYDKKGIAFDGSPNGFDRHTIVPNLTLTYSRGLQRGTEYHYSCNNLVINRIGEISVFNDTIYSSNHCLIKYAMVRNESNLFFYSNIRKGRKKGYRIHRIDKNIIRKDFFTDWIYCFGQLIQLENKTKVVPVDISLKPHLSSFK